MGQKVHPYGFRLGYIKDWHSSWYSKKTIRQTLKEDMKIRSYIDKILKMLLFHKQRFKNFRPG